MYQVIATHKGNEVVNETVRLPRKCCELAHAAAVHYGANAVRIIYKSCDGDIELHAARIIGKLECAAEAQRLKLKLKEVDTQRRRLKSATFADRYGTGDCMAWHTERHS